MNEEGIKHQVLIAFSGVLVSEKPSSQNFVLSFSIPSKKSYQTALITKSSSAYSTPNCHLVQLQKILEPVSTMTGLSYYAFPPGLGSIPATGHAFHPRWEKLSKAVHITIETSRCTLLRR